MTRSRNLTNFPLYLPIIKYDIIYNKFPPSLRAGGSLIAWQKNWSFKTKNKCPKKAMEREVTNHETLQSKGCRANALDPNAKYYPKYYPKILAILERLPEASTQKIADEIGAKSDNIRPLLDNLANCEILKKEGGGKGGRRAIYSLTDYGKSVATQEGTGLIPKRRPEPDRSSLKDRLLRKLR